MRPTARAQCCDELLERRARDELERDEVRAAQPAELVDARDVRVLEVAREPRLVDERATSSGISATCGNRRLSATGFLTRRGDLARCTDARPPAPSSSKIS